MSCAGPRTVKLSLFKPASAVASSCFCAAIMLAVNHQVVLVATGLPRQAYAFKAPLVARACACSLNRLTKREDAAQSRIAHVSKPVSLARHVQGKAANKTEAMPASSSTTGTSGSNGWAWLFGSLTLSSGVAAPALYIGSHWNEVCFTLAKSCYPFSNQKNAGQFCY